MQVAKQMIKEIPEVLGILLVVMFTSTITLSVICGFVWLMLKVISEN